MMNERLRELMLEAGYAAPEIAGRANKLAELIVRECLAECWYDATPKQIADNIRQKFGVEE
jgi:hypothetical protein